MDKFNDHIIRDLIRWLLSLPEINPSQIVKLSRDFIHLVITRFNLRKLDWQATKNNEAVLTAKWLSNRLELFEKYCLPSVANQDNRNFTWLVYFDTTTPAEFIPKINLLSNNGRNFTPVFIDGMDAFLPAIRNYIQSLETSYVITSRVDNDDCLHHRFIEEVQKRFNRQDYLAIDFIDGFSLQLVPVVRAGLKRWASNPFISLIEKKETAQSVWFRSHTDWKREKRIVVIRGIRVWMQVVHYENKVNKFSAYGHVPLDPLLKEMNIDEEERKRLQLTVSEVSSWRFFSWRSKIDVYITYYWQLFKKKIGYYKVL